MNKHYIYAYVDPRDNKVRYIGQGINERWLAQHKTCEQYGVWPWLQRLKALGLRPIRFIVLEGLTKPQADRWEIDLIDLIGRHVAGEGPLLNLSTGGANSSQGVIKSAETRRKLSESNKGRKCKPFSEEHRRKLSETKKGNTNSKGRVITTEFRRRMSEINKGNTNCKGRKHSEETKRKISETEKQTKAAKKQSALSVL